MDWHVELATGDDVDALADLWVALVRDQGQYGTHLRGAANRSLATQTIRQYVHAEGIAVARGETGELLGFVMFHVQRGMYEQDARRGAVENVFVVPSARDAGIGGDLLSFAEAALTDRGADVASLSVMADNERAARFYRRRGYEAHRIEMERPLD
ncbi:MAG: GNAT family N-acetyltransferase [Halanaeroarchaeum sp.]